MGSVRYTVDDNHNVSEIHKVVVHTFHVASYNDPDIEAAEPIWKWQQTDAGKFVIENAIDEPEWHRYLEHLTLNYKYAIIAELEKKKLSEFYLRFGKINA
jgi:hypothetical protein